MRGKNLQGVNMSEWQPIETAPKDGRDVLIVSDAYRDRVLVARWYKYNGKEGFRDWDADLHLPTHWMPLPEPPK